MCRWCCSGTPISTEVKDFTAQFAFLGVEPFGNKTYFNVTVHDSWQEQAENSRSEVCSGTNALLYALGRTLMRHTKAQTVGGQAVSHLPAKSEETLAVSFSGAEAEVYLRVHKKAKAVFERFLGYGGAHVSKHLLAIMSLLGPLRRCCSGGALRQRELQIPDVGYGVGHIPGFEAAEGAPAAAAVVDKSLVAPQEECSVCLNGFEHPTITPCGHWFCRECILAETGVRHKCPLCRGDLAAEGLREGVLPNEQPVLEQEAAVQDQMDKGRAEPSTQGNPGGSPCSEHHVLFESKLNMPLNELAAMRERDPAAKALIFTQFSGTLNWLAAHLQQEGYGYRTISGSMPLKKRSQAIEAFQKDPPTTVFLLSMRSGAVGINLTAANHVFLMEPAFNPALEDQAVGRAHRMGQTRPVTVKKFYIQGSVEERIMEVIKQRKAGQGLGGSGDVEDSIPYYGPRGKARPQQDVAGCLRTDRQNLRSAELELLFKDPSFSGPQDMGGAADCCAGAAAP